jgi:hypothetical protein
LLAEIENTSRITRFSTDSKTLIIDLIPSALTTNTTNWIVSSNAAANTIIKNFINTASNNTVACWGLSISGWAGARSSLWVISTISLAFSTSSIDSEELRSTVTISSYDVEWFIGKTGNSTDSKVSIIKIIDWTFLANTSNKVKVRVTDTTWTSNEKGIRISTVWRFYGQWGFYWGSSTRNTGSTIECVSNYTFTLGRLFVVDGVSWADSTSSVDVDKSTVADTSVAV